MLTLTIATRNPHKTAEIRAMIDHRMLVRDVTEIGNLPTVEETGDTFLANATLKAIAISQAVSGWVLADDSGLEIPALGGAPGVWSSSYGGEEGNHEKNNLRLQRELASLGNTSQPARFRCVMVLAKDGVAQAHFDGTVEGVVTVRPSGTTGFGYDPHFIPHGYQQSFAELGDAVKNQLSHRSHALQAAVQWLIDHQATI